MIGPALRIEVVYATPGAERVYVLDLAPGATLGDAVRASGVLNDLAEIDPARLRVGIWNRLTSPETRLRDGDRVEIYRPLHADPKTARRRKAAPAKRKCR